MLVRKSFLHTSLILASLFFAIHTLPKGGGGGSKPAAKAPSAEELKAAELARRESERLKTLALQRSVHYGDKIVLLNKDEYSALSANGSIPVVMARKGNNDAKNSDDAAQLWYVKGKHTKKDPWNCIPGDEVKNGDVIRLECIATGSNLSTTGSGDNVSLGLNGSGGIGNSKDNWILQVQGGTVWTWGMPCSLVNVDTGHVLNVQSGGVINIIKSVTKQAKQSKEDTAGMDAATQQIFKDQQAKADAAQQQQQQAQTQQTTGTPQQNQQATAAKPATTKLDTPAPSDPTTTMWWVCNAQVAQPPENDIGWTGSPSGSPSEADDSALVSIEIVKLGMGGGIPQRATQDFEALSADKKPYLSGFAKDTIDGFTSSFMLNVNPLKNKGCAWLGESLKTPGKATIKFRAKSEDKGDIQVIFAQDIGIDFVYKIRIGAYDNTQTVIERYEHRGALNVRNTVAVVSQDQNPLAAARPGTYVDYWVSIDNGLIFVGASQNPGENIFLTWRDPNPVSDLRRVGFGSNMTRVVYSEVQVRPEVKAQPPVRIYFPSANGGASPSFTAQKWASNLFLSKPGDSEPESKVEWSTYPLRVPGRGSVGFTLKGTQETAVILADTKDTTGDFYAVVFGAEGNDGVRIKKHTQGEIFYQELAATKAKNYRALLLSPDRPAKYWISVQNGQLLVGMGEIGSNVLLGVQDILPLSDIHEIGFTCNASESATYSALSIASPISTAVVRADESYQRTAKEFNYQGSIYIVLPFEYQIDQEGQAVKFMDKIGGQTFYPGATPQQDAKYFFMITVQPDGFPQLDWVSEPENKAMIALQKKVTISQATQEALASAGQSVSGSGMIGGLIGTAASIAFAGAAAAIGSKETAIAQAALGQYRDNNAYVYTDKMNTASLGSTDIPPEAQANALQAKNQMDLGGKWTPSSTDKYERLISLYQQVVFLVTHPYVVQDPSIKPNLFNSIAALYKARQVLYPGLDYDGAQAAYNSLLNLLISAHDNQYLINPDIPDEAKQKDIWYTWINELSRDLLANHATTEVELKPFHGEYVWLTDILPKENEGIVVFEAKGLNDVFIAFGQAPFKTRNTSNEIYEINIGAFENSRTVIRVQSLDRPIAQFNKQDKPDAMLNPMEYKRFWIAISKGTLTLGAGDIAEANKILEWTDIYPIERLKYVGLSTWNAPILFKNMYVGPFSNYAAAAAWDPTKKKATAAKPKATTNNAN